MEKPDNERLEDLEVLASHQARMLDELNEVVVEQGKMIADLRRRLDMAGRRFSEIEDRMGSQVPIDKPPHW